MHKPAAKPLRALLVCLVLAGFSVWQAWQCTEAMMPMAMTAAMTYTDHVVEVEVEVAEPDNNSGMPSGMAAVCISVLASLAAALLLMRSPLRPLALLRPLTSLLVSPAPVPIAREPRLSQLCVSRT